MGKGTRRETGGARAAGVARADGGADGIEAAGGPGLAVRAEVGRVPLPRVQGGRRGRDQGEVRQVAVAVLSRGGREPAARCRRHLRPRRRARHPVGGTLSFDALQMRLHPAASRIERLARETPAALILFDCLLRTRGEPLLARPFEARRSVVEALADEIGEAGRGLAHAVHPRPGAGGGMARRAPCPDGRGDGEAPGPALPAGGTGDAEG